ncbi:hypothetical protein AALP_AA3G084100 [Arabis alpina]|uniref:Uncharacterized protein n=1 Tax=Arabis alpina TaxID=50452 RepID=A0A087H7W5_ARAAL|nr:hypothetical protein AALP_AA3G084100 [Arabis alpina]
MLRTRLLWFTLGFSVSGASIAHLVWRDLYAERYAISSDMKEKFHALEGRVSGLESASYENPSPAQVISLSLCTSLNSSL